MIGDKSTYEAELFNTSSQFFYGICRVIHWNHGKASQLIFASFYALPIVDDWPVDRYPEAEIQLLDCERTWIVTFPR